MKFRQTTVIITLALVALTVVLPIRGKDNRRASWESGADSRKADFIYMEALRQNVLENDDAFFELLRRANDLDSTETGPGQMLGYYYMALGRRDSLFATNGYRMIRRHFDAHPEDYYGAIFYGMVNNQLNNNKEAIRVWQILDSLHPDKPDVALQYASALQQSLDTANLRRSIGVLARIERAEGRDLGLTSHKIRAYLALRDTVSSMAEIHSLLESSPRNAEYCVYTGDIFMAIAKPDSAIVYYNRACEVDSANGWAYYKRAEFYRERGDSTAFDREVFRALRQESLGVDVKLEMLGSYIRQLYADTIQRPRIEALFEDLLLQHPHEAEIHDLYSSYLIAIGNLRGAAEQQEYALDIDPSNEGRWRAAMGLYVQAEDLDKSISLGERALHYLPESPVINLMMGANYQQKGDDPRAVEYFREAYRVTPESDNSMRSQIIASIGDSFYKIGEKDSAFVYYDQAIEINPDNLLALNNCAYYLAEEGRDLDRAENMSAICVRANPENDTALDTYAWVFFKKKNYARAKEIIDRALSVEGDDAEADVLHHAGDIYYMNGEPDEAVAFWERALRLDPDNALLQKKVKHKTHFFE